MTATRDYRNHFGVAYQASNDMLRVTVPDRVHYPSCTGWAWLQDTRTLVLSPDPPAHNTGAEQVHLGRQRNLPGCRIFELIPVRGIGPHFRMCETVYRAQGERFLVAIPPEEERLPPKQFRGRGRGRQQRGEAVVPTKPAETNRLVLVERGAEQLSFSVPDTVLSHVLGEWMLEGYLVDK